MTKNEVNKFRKVLEASAMELDGPARRHPHRGKRR